MILTDFNKIDTSLYTSNNVKIDCFEHKEESILVINITGKLEDGSAAANDCNYIREQIAIAIYKTTPIAIIIDIQDMQYQYGNSIINAFAPLYEIDLFDGDGFIYAFVLSDKNKYGLSSLWVFDIDSPREGIYYNFDKAMQYILERYEKI